MFVQQWDPGFYASYRSRCGNEARKLLHPELPPAAYFDRLVEQEHFVDAIRLYSYLVPARAAVWWGCLCLWDSGRQVLPETQHEALRLAVQWVMEPTESNRRAAEPYANLDTPAGCLAFAVFWSGGSVVGAELPAVPPPVHINAATIGSAVLLMAAEYAPLQFDACCRRLLAVGLQLAQGKHLWEAAASLPKPAPAPAMAGAFVV